MLQSAADRLAALEGGGFAVVARIIPVNRNVNGTLR